MCFIDEYKKKVGLLRQSNITTAVVVAIVVINPSQLTALAIGEHLSRRHQLSPACHASTEGGGREGRRKGVLATNNNLWWGNER